MTIGADAARRTVPAAHPVVPRSWRLTPFRAFALGMLFLLLFGIGLALLPAIGHAHETGVPGGAHTVSADPRAR